jgi:hypothetical protein
MKVDLWKSLRIAQTGDTLYALYSGKAGILKRLLQINVNGPLL